MKFKTAVHTIGINPSNHTAVQLNILIAMALFSCLIQPSLVPRPSFCSVEGGSGDETSFNPDSLAHPPSLIGRLNVDKHL